MSEDLKEIMKDFWDEFRKTITVEAAIGKPIEIDDKTLIPIFRVAFGAGGGGGIGNEEKKGGEGYGAGGGGAIDPVALMAVFKGIPGPDGLTVLSLKPTGVVDKIVGEALPMVMDMVKEMKEGEETKEGKKAEKKK